MLYCTVLQCIVQYHPMCKVEAWDGGRQGQLLESCVIGDPRCRTHGGDWGSLESPPGSSVAQHLPYNKDVLCALPTSYLYIIYPVYLVSVTPIIYITLLYCTVW